MEATEVVSQPAVFDLSSLDVVRSANDGVAIDILHPVTKEPLGITITVLGADSAAFKKLATDQNRRRLAKMEKQGGFKPSAVTQDERDEDAIELLAACTKAWNGVVLDAVTLECNRDNAMGLYERLPWLREQIDVAIGDRANFIKG